MKTQITLDRFDRAILEMIQIDNKVPQRSIGEKINLSAPAVQRRIKRMEDSGVIRANVAIADPVSLGSPLTLIVGVEIESERAELIDKIKRAFVDTGEVQQCYYVTGDFDFILIIAVRTMSDYECLTRKLFFDNPNVKRFRTSVAMDRVKVSCYVPAL
jgi:Lrp/AsnC family transcriptional regulator, leucine-responsive regulatory protein